MILNLDGQQREYVIAALKFAQWALLQTDDLTDAIHQAVYDHYEAQAKEDYPDNQFQATISFAEDLTEINAIFDTFDTGDNMGARCDVGAIIEALENGTGANV